MGGPAAAATLVAAARVSDPVDEPTYRATNACETPISEAPMLSRWAKCMALERIDWT